MKNLLFVIFSFCIFLTGCSSNQANYKFDNNLSREEWLRQIETDPTCWTRGADAWFISGDAHATEAPRFITTTVSTMKINAPFFSAIHVNGHFKVQIFGTSGPNSVYVYGPQEGVNDTIVTVKGNMIYLTQRQKASRLVGEVIIRIGVNHLNHLVQRGPGIIEGVRLHEDCLDIISVGSGNIYLAGCMQVTSIKNLASSCVSVIGARTPSLDIISAGTGSTNVSGTVGVRTIIHHGTGDINIIGANSDNLRILADGKGKIGISGIVNLCELRAREYVRVYVAKVMSGNLRVYANDRVCIGLMGAARDFDVQAAESSFVGASRLCAEDASVRTFDTAHVNVSASREMFASASGKSSIYFYGPMSVLSKTTSEDGFVMQVCSGVTYCPILPPQPPPLMMRGAG